MATFEVFANDAWRIWALQWLTSGGYIQHHVAAAKAAAELAGITAQQNERNARDQSVFKLEMFRGLSPLGDGPSAFCHVPDDVRTDSAWRAAVDEQRTHANATAAQAACWTTDAVTEFVSAKPGDLQHASRALEGETKLLVPSWYVKAVCAVARRQRARGLATAIVEGLAWAEDAAGKGQLSAATRAEFEGRDSWLKIEDVDESQRIRTSISKKAHTESMVDFKAIIDTLQM